MEKPVLSPNFTIEDIHRLREYYYFLTRDMTSQERKKFYKNIINEFQEKMERKRVAWKELERV